MKKLIFISIFLTVILIALVVAIAVTIKSPKFASISADKQYVAAHFISFDSGVSPYADHVLIQKKGFFFDRFDIDASQFVGYCDRDDNKLVIEWSENNMLNITCDVLSCGLIRSINPETKSFKINYKFKNYDPDEKFYNSPACNP